MPVVAKKSGCCSCFGCLGIPMMMYCVLCLGYLLNETEKNNWDVHLAFDKIQARIMEQHYPRLKNKIMSLIGLEDKLPPEALNQLEESFNAVTNWLGSGDEAYARARQLLFKANGAAGDDKRKIVQNVIDELNVAIENYQKALSNDESNPHIKAKINETQKSIEVLKQQ